MTDNRTNEELASRLRQFAESQAMDFDSPYTAMMLNEVADRIEQAEQALQRVREVIEREKHWNDGCGWDVPVIALTRALEGDE